MVIDKASANEKLIREGYGAFKTGDLQAVQAMFRDDVTWYAGRAGQLSGEHAGWPAVQDFFIKTMELSDWSFAIEVLDVLAGDTRAAVYVRQTARRGDLVLDDRQVHLFEIDADGKVAHVHQYVGDFEATSRFWE